MQGPAAHSEVTADGTVKDAGGHLVSVLLTAGSDQATIILYDNTAASGTKLCTLKAAANTTVQWSPAVPIVFSTGIHADITGTGPTVTVAYI